MKFADNNMTADVQQYMCEQCSPAFNIQLDEVKEFINLLNKVKASYSGNASVFKTILDLLVRIHLEPATKQDNYEQIILKSRLIQLMYDEPLLGLQLVNYIDRAQENPNHPLHASPLNVSGIHGDRFTLIKNRNASSSVTKCTGPEFQASRNRIPLSLKDAPNKTKIEQLKRKVADLQRKVNETVTVLKKRRRSSSTYDETLSLADKFTKLDRRLEGIVGANVTVSTAEPRSDSDEDALVIVDDDVDDETVNSFRHFSYYQQLSSPFPSTGYGESTFANPVKTQTSKQHGIVFSDVGKNCIVVSVKNVGDGRAPSSSTLFAPIPLASDVDGVLVEENSDNAHSRMRKQKTPTIKITSLISKRKAFEKSLSLSRVMTEKGKERDGQTGQLNRPVRTGTKQSSSGKSKQKRRKSRKSVTKTSVTVDRHTSASAKSLSKICRLEGIIVKLHSAKRSSNAC